jgi:hypothetical protein
MRSTQNGFLLQGSAVSALCRAYQGRRTLRSSGKHTGASDAQIDVAKPCKFPLCSGR